MFDERAHFSAIGSESPSVVDFVRPASALESILKIVQCALRHIDEEPIDAHHFDDL